MIVTMSDSALSPFRVDGVTMISHKSIMATFANPIIMLFLGGFFLAAAATKYKMDLNLARVLLKPFGKNPKFVLLGLMLITAVFSMFMSNTATAAMMLAILAPTKMTAVKLPLPSLFRWAQTSVVWVPRSERLLTLLPSAP